MVILVLRGVKNVEDSSVEYKKRPSSVANSHSLSRLSYEAYLIERATAVRTTVALLLSSPMTTSRKLRIIISSFASSKSALCLLLVGQRVAHKTRSSKETASTCRPNQPTSPAFRLDAVAGFETSQ
jgi:hypothetical protein